MQDSLNVQSQCIAQSREFYLLAERSADLLANLPTSCNAMRDGITVMQVQPLLVQISSRPVQSMVVLYS